MFKRLAFVPAVLVSVVSLAQAQAPAAPTVPAKAAPGYTPKKTAWGDPDLQGNYTNKYEQGTPFERPAEFDGKKLGDVKGADLAEVIKKHFPDWRRVLNELQRYSATGAIDSGILSNMTSTTIKELVAFMKDKNFTEIRKWTKNNLDVDVNQLFNQFYEVSSDVMDTLNSAQLVLHLAKYQYQNAFAANPEINFLAFLVEVMKDCEFK